MSRLASLALVAFVPFALVACGGEQAQAPAAKAPLADTQTAAAKPANSVPPSSESAVSISDAILKACGIATDEAFFPYDSSKVLNDSVKPLNDVAKCFTSGPLKGKSMKLVGHADPRGDTDYNVQLGLHRADSVSSYLRNRGVPSKQVSTTSRGAMDATGSDEASWAKDRRVDVMLGD